MNHTPIKLLIYALFLSLSYFHVHAQDDWYEDDDYTYYEEHTNKNILEGGGDFLIPHGDFGNKIGKNSLGGSFTYLRQINYSRFFLGLNFTPHQLDKYKISEYEPDVNQSTYVANYKVSLLGRIYPEFHISVFEFFFDAGAGINIIRGSTDLYDVIAEEVFDSFKESSDRSPVFFAGGGFHVPFSENWFLTGKVNSFFGTTIDYIAKKSDLSNITETYLAFDFKSSSYTANSISLSLSFLF